MLNPDGSSGVVRFFRSPVLWLVTGGVAGSALVQSYFAPAYVHLQLAVALAVLGFGLLVLLGRTVPVELGVFLIGAGLFLVLAGLQAYRADLKHQRINNRRLHLVGTLDPPHDFDVHRVNGEEVALRFFLLDTPTDLQGRFVTTKTRRLELTGRVEWYELSNSFRGFLENRRYHGALRNLTLHGVSPTEGGGFLVSARNRVTEWLRQREVRAPYSTSMAQALLTGDRQFPTHLEMLFRRLGMVHLFVISGFHVGLLFLLLGKLTEWASPSVQAGTVGFVLIAYLWFLGWPVSATRAGLMIGFGLIATHLNRRATLYDVLLATVLVLMLFDPFVVFDVGFQLSVAAVAGIQLVYPTLRSFEGGFGRSYFWVSVGAYAGTLPVILHHFQYVAPLALPGSVLAGVLFPALLGFLVLQGVFLAVEWTFLVGWIEWGLARGVGILLRGIESSGWVWGVPEPSLWVLVVLVLSLAVVLSSSFSLPARFLGGFGVVLILGVLTGGPRPSFVELRNVRDVSVVSFRAGNGLTGLVLPPGERTTDYQVGALARLLKNRGIHHVDYFVSDYSRRLFAQFDPDFTVGTFVDYRGSRGKLRWPGGHFDVRNLQLKSGDTTISFDSSRFFETLEEASETVVATTSDGRCVLVGTDRLDHRGFERLRSLKCRLTFLREGPLVYGGDGAPARSAEQRVGTLTFPDGLRTFFE